MPPISRAPSTISIGALSPTSSDRSGESTSIADVAAISKRDQAERVGDQVPGPYR